MKIAAVILLALSCVSCQTPAENERLSALVGFAINAAERRGIISAEDAADVRAAKVIVLDPVVVEAEAPSGK
jgi:hypothetical protein